MDLLAFIHMLMKLSSILEVDPVALFMFCGIPQQSSRRVRIAVVVVVVVVVVVGTRRDKLKYMKSAILIERCLSRFVKHSLLRSLWIDL